MLSMKARVISRSGRALSETEKSCLLGSQNAATWGMTMGNHEKHERHEKVMENFHSRFVSGKGLKLRGMIG
jgi:hypothetical protein